MNTSTMTINKGYAINPKLDKDNNVVTTSIAISDDTSIDTTAYLVSFKSADFRIPDSKYVLDVDTFISNVQTSATAMVINDIVNAIGKMTSAIDNMLSDDSVDVATLADTISRRDALKSFIANKRKSVSGDTIATTFAYCIVQSKNVKFTDADKLLKTIRDAYTNKTDKVTRATRDNILAFCNKYLVIADADKSVVYKNIRVKLSEDKTRDIINLVSACPLVYGKKGIVDKRMTENKAIAQVCLYVLRETFGLSINNVKTDTTSYLLVG